MGFLGSYSKTYGQVYIVDDAFLATTATVQNFVNGGGRILWGFIYDYLGYRVLYSVVENIFLVYLLRLQVSTKFHVVN